MDWAGTRSHVSIRHGVTTFKTPLYAVGIYETLQPDYHRANAGI